MELNLDQIIEKDIYEEIKKKLELFEKIDIAEVNKNCDSEDIEEESMKIVDEYDFYQEKSEIILSLKELDNDKKKETIEMIFKIKSSNNLTEKQKVKTMISYSALVDNFKKINEKTEEEIFMLSASSSTMDLEDYPFFMAIMSDEKVPKSIISKTIDFGTQIQIAFHAIDSLYKVPYDYISADNYDELVNYAINIINNYSIEYVK